MDPRHLAALALALVAGCAGLSGLGDYSYCVTNCNEGGAGGGSSGGLADAPPGDDAPGSDGSVEAESSDDAPEVTTPVDTGSDEASYADANASTDGEGGHSDAGNIGDAVTDSRGEGGDGGIGSGLVAYYAFDESTGTTAADSSGHGNTATLMGNATFAAGVLGNAVNLDGASGYVVLPSGIVMGLTSFSIACWVNLNATPTWSRIFDFGTGTTSYMFLTPNSGQNTRFAITTGGGTQEQQTNASPLGTLAWHHVAVTLAGTTVTLYLDGAAVATQPSTTLNPSSLGTTNKNWIGRSQYAADSYLNGRVDNFRIYDRPLGGAEVQALYAGNL
jgi:Concanavalin A-like lectin/glucanases superfamily